MARSMGSVGSRSLASTPWRNSSANPASGAPAPAVQRVTAPPSKRTRVSTTMRLWVRVPVLSVHNTVVAPRVSMVAARRVSTRCCDSRQAPMAMKTVRISRNSCGSMDMARVMPASSAATQSPWVQRCSPATDTLTTSASTEKRRTSTRVWRCSGVVSGTRAANTLPMRPISLRAPVATTSARAWPATSTVPANTRAVPSACRATGSDSPLSSDSSSCRSLACSRRASAGTRSPSASSMRSPQTSSLPATRRRSPSRQTNARGLLRSCKASSTRSVRRSCTRVMVTMTPRKASSTAASCRSPSTR